jgi:hypothetical protein
MPSKISAKGGASFSHGKRPSRWWLSKLAATAITTGSVPMIMVGSAPPARWMALDRNR